jgi:hypothetical protein
MTIRQWVGMLAMAALVLADQSTLGAVSCFFPLRAHSCLMGAQTS